ncbi:MAG: DUF4338 domain-containing protein [Elusimicrobiota bacterium]
MGKQIPLTVCGKDFSQHSLNRINIIIQNNPTINRTKLSRVLCREFGWASPNGHLKEMSCRVALLKLHRANFIQLPPPKKQHYLCRKLKITSISEPQPLINKNICDISNLKLNLVQSKKDSQLWNQLIERYHYLGYKPLSGAQLRYFISCSDGLLAAISFSAAAWKIAPRDNWIGWNNNQRQKNLYLIANNSRFLIFPWIKIPHLASKILSISAKQLPLDWIHKYSYKPVLLETFVEKDRFQGTCYRAANWISAGQTTGRGKKDFHHLHPLPVKCIWLYPLNRDFRKILCTI